MSEYHAATVVQSSWRGFKAREGAREKRALVASGIASAAGEKNARKTPGTSAANFAAEVSRRPRVEGGVHGGTIRVVLRHVHFLRGVFLHIRIVSAENLLPMDSNGLSDPYVKVSLVDDDGTPYKKMVHRVPFEHATLNPEWDYSFYMGSADLDLRQEDPFRNFRLRSVERGRAMGAAIMPFASSTWTSRRSSSVPRGGVPENQRRRRLGSASFPRRGAHPLPTLPR